MTLLRHRAPKNVSSPKKACAACTDRRYKVICSLGGTALSPLAAVTVLSLLREKLVLDGDGLGKGGERRQQCQPNDRKRRLVAFFVVSGHSFLRVRV